MPADQVVFYILAVGALAGAIALVLPPFGRNPLHGALALIVSFLFLAGIYVQLSAHFVAVIQILVYAGAVMTLFVFVIMLLNLRPEELKGAKVTWYKVLSVIAAAGLVYYLLHSIVGGLRAFRPVNVPGDYGSTAALGDVLVKKWLFAFEFSSILLLVAIVGAVVVARKWRVK